MKAWLSALLHGASACHSALSPATQALPSQKLPAVVGCWSTQEARQAAMFSCWLCLHLLSMPIVSLEKCLLLLLRETEFTSWSSRAGSIWKHQKSTATASCQMHNGTVIAIQTERGPPHSCEPDRQIVCPPLHPGFLQNMPTSDGCRTASSMVTLDIPLVTLRIYQRKLSLERHSSHQNPENTAFTRSCFSCMVTGVGVRLPAAGACVRLPPRGCSQGADVGSGNPSQRPGAAADGAAVSGAVRPLLPPPGGA